MLAQIILNTTLQKHLIGYALAQKIKPDKRTYIAYGTTNMYILYHLGLDYKDYVAGCFVKNRLNVNQKRPKPVILYKNNFIDIADFEVNKNDLIIKGANALWYEGNKKYAAVAAADKNGGTYANVYLKAAIRGAEVLIAVSHEKLIPFYNESSQNVEYSMGSKISMLKMFYGNVYTETEALEDVFGLKSKIIASGGVLGNEGSVVLEVFGEKTEELIEFISKYENLNLEKNCSFELLF